MTMSGRVQAQTLLQPSSPEKQRSVGGKCKAFLLKEQPQRQQQPHETMTTTTTRVHSASLASTNDKWEPDEDEVRALAMRDFDVIGVLGVGTYGVVKLAKHVASGASVALKVLSKEQVVSMRQEKHILRERMVHLRLKHAFIARLYGTFQDEDCLYLVIEYLPGGELWSLVYSDFDNNDEDGNDGEDIGDSENENETPDERVVRTITTSEDEQGDNGDDEQVQCRVVGQQSSLGSAGIADSEKDTEARHSTPTEADDAMSLPSSLPAPLLLNNKLTLNLVPDEPTGTYPTQQQGEHQPRRRRLSSYIHPPNSPAHHHAIRLDARSRGLLRNAHGGLKEDHAVFYLACILRALEYLHAQDLLYRDLKLENLVLDRAGYPKVLDFGFAKQNAVGPAGERNMTLCGSMDYMAPEILLHEPHDQRVDIWSFGVIMYEMLLGKTPFYHENARELGRKITTEPVVFPSDFEQEHPAACDLIAKLLVKAPADRLNSMAELRKHAFFQRRFPDASAWEALERKERAAPFVPKLAGPFDTSFFQKIDDETQDELNDFAQPYFEDGSHIFRAF